LESPQCVGEFLVGLYDQQTKSEQVRGQTFDRNGRGFSAADAPDFTKMAQFFLAHGYLRDFQLAMCRKLDKNGRPRLAKYHRQICERLNSKVGISQPTPHIPEQIQ
jgi:hypothetical protein